LWAACAANTAHAQSNPGAVGAIGSIFNQQAGVGSGPGGVSAAQGTVTPASGNSPPNFDKSTQDGALIKSGENNMLGWRYQLTGELANYNVYTQQQTDNDKVISILKNCKGSNGNKSYACDFSQLASGGEVNVSSLLGFAGYPNDQLHNAAFSYIMKSSNFSPAVYPGDKVVFKDPNTKNQLTSEGITYYAQVLKQLANLTVPQFVLLGIFNDRERQPGLGQNTPAGDGKGSASILEMMQYEANRRYTNPAWFQAMNGATDQAVQREIAYELAFQNYMMVKQYEQNQKLEVLMAGLINAINTMNSSTQNTEQMKKSIQIQQQQAS
jgi:hypothetical protein